MTSARRPYRKRKRAEQEAETRRRITEAAVELHGTLGPHRTTVTEVAKKAGVGRMTVYNHFPTEVDLGMACSTHWATQNPFPDPTLWLHRGEPAARLRVGLVELYAWYAAKQDMLANVFRDLEVTPWVEVVMGELWTPWIESVIEVLATGWPEDAESDADELVPMLRLVVDFHTWHALSAAGVEPARAADLVARMVLGVVGPAATDG